MGPCTLLPHFRFFINSVFFLSYHKFQTKAAPTFAQGSKNLFSHIKFIVKFLPNRWRSTVSFSVFQLFWAMLTLNNFSKNLKLRVRYFFGTLDYILRGKKRWRQPGRFEVERPIYIFFFCDGEDFSLAPSEVYGKLRIPRVEFQNFERGASDRIISQDLLLWEWERISVLARIAFGIPWQVKRLILKTMGAVGHHAYP